MEIYSSTRPQKCCVFIPPSETRSSTCYVQTLCWANEITKTHPQPSPTSGHSFRTQLQRGRCDGGGGEQCRRQPKFGLHSLSCPICKMRRFLKWDHPCPMTKLNRHQWPRLVPHRCEGSRGQKDDTNVPDGCGPCEGHSQALWRRVPAVCQPVKGFTSIIRLVFTINLPGREYSHCLDR